jgi:hypothetical protein
MIIGEMALIDSCNRSATVVAKDNCVLAQVNESEFLSLMEKIPRFGLISPHRTDKRRGDRHPSNVFCCPDTCRSLTLENRFVAGR